MSSRSSSSLQAWLLPAGATLAALYLGYAGLKYAQHLRQFRRLLRIKRPALTTLIGGNWCVPHLYNSPYCPALIAPPYFPAPPGRSGHTRTRTRSPHLAQEEQAACRPRPQPPPSTGGASCVPPSPAPSSPTPPPPATQVRAEAGCRAPHPQAGEEVGGRPGWRVQVSAWILGSADRVGGEEPTCPGGEQLRLLRRWAAPGQVAGSSLLRAADLLHAGESRREKGEEGR